MREGKAEIKRRRENRVYKLLEDDDLGTGEVTLSIKACQQAAPHQLIDTSARWHSWTRSPVCRFSASPSPQICSLVPALPRACS